MAFFGFPQGKGVSKVIRAKSVAGKMANAFVRYLVRQDRKRKATSSKLPKAKKGRSR